MRNTSAAPGGRPPATSAAAIGTDAAARNATFFEVEEAGRRWSVRQVLDDPEGDHEWIIQADVDLDASDEAGVAVLRVLDVTRR